MNIPSRTKVNGPENNHGSAPLQDIAASAHGVVDQAADMGHEAVDGAVAAVEPAQAWVSEQCDTLAAAQRDAIADAREYIVANPLKSIGIALAAGLVIGRIGSALR